jgi:hypothetical protein
MMDGEGDAVSGWKNKLQAAVANVTAASVLAHQHAKRWWSWAPGKIDRKPLCRMVPL